MSEIRGQADDGGDLYSDDISRAYRLAAREEPPPELDDAIHAAALRAAGPRPKRVTRAPLRRWSVPIAVAATIVVGVSVAFLAADPPGSPSVLVTEAPAPNAAAARSPGEGVREAPQPAPGASSGQDHVAAAARDARPSRERTTRDQFVPKREELASPSAAPESEAHSETTLDQFRATPGAELPTPPPLAVPGRAKGIRKTVPGADMRAGSEVELSPELWLQHIREFRNKGELAQADESLRVFRLRYPDYPLPADIPAPTRIDK